jgi:hypothetical protein
MIFRYSQAAQQKYYSLKRTKGGSEALESRLSSSSQSDEIEAALL